MASRGGPMVDGTDGADFQYRQRVAAPHRISMLNKKRLTSCIYCHLILLILMICKLTPDILDRADVFVLEVEELEVPTPQWWEYIWMISVITIPFGFRAMAANSVQKMQKYILGLVLTGVLPIAYCMVYYFSDFWEFIWLENKFDLEDTDIALWNGLPLGVLWYAFGFAALQVLGFTLYFAYKCIQTWRSRIAAKKGI